MYARTACSEKNGSAYRKCRKNSRRFAGRTPRGASARMSCRKKIDSKIWNEWSEYALTMETEVRSLRQDVARAQDSLRAATRRCHELVRELASLGAEHERERLLRDRQLSRILRALLVLESRLKQEQKSIRQLLCEKDNVIRNQQLEISRLRRYTKSYIKGKREHQQQQQQKQQKQGCRTPAGVVDVDDDEDDDDDGGSNDPLSLESCDFQDHDGSLSKDIQKLKCEIMTKLNEGGLDSVSAIISDPHAVEVNIRKTHSFAGSDISKASLTSSENTDASIITTTTEGSPSLLSTEGFCEGESTDVSPGSTLNKSSSRCTPTIVTTDSETEAATTTTTTTTTTRTTLAMLDERPKPIARTESKDDGLDCNYASDEDEEDDEDGPMAYESGRRDVVGSDAAGNTGSRSTKGAGDGGNGKEKVDIRTTKIGSDDQSQEEESGNWYSDPDEDRLNDELLRHSVYRPNGNHNSVLECVNQILLRDMEEEESALSVPRRFKHRGKIVRFQPARLSDIESVGSEMERRNSEEAAQIQPAGRTAVGPDAIGKEDANDNEADSPIDGFEATNSEDEFGMRIVPALDPESGLEEDVDDTKARPIVIIEPCVKVEESMNNSIMRSLNKNNRNSSPTPLYMERMKEQKGLKIAKNLDYEDIESLPDVISPPPRIGPVLPPKPQFRNTLILKKIPSPSFLIDETSRKKQINAGIYGAKTPLIAPIPIRSLKFDDVPKKNNVDAEDATSAWKNRFNNVRSSFQLRQGNGEPSRSPPEPHLNGRLPKVTNIVRQFEEFKIGGNNEAKDGYKKPQQQQQPIAESQIDDYDIQQNFEEFNLDECDLSDDPDRPAAEGSETLVSLANNANGSVLANESSGKIVENNNVAEQITQQQQQQQQQQQPQQQQQQLSNGNAGIYDNFLEATGLSNKSILTPSRLLSNHKSMLKPKDVKYKSKIKATAVLERHGAASATSITHTKHWTGPFV